MRRRRKRAYGIRDAQNHTLSQLDAGADTRNSLPMPETPSWIGIVDDDPSVLKALARLLRTRAFDVRSYGSAQAFLAALPDGLPACLLLDLQMP
jgi:PleD family two-component response regulator